MPPVSGYGGWAGIVWLNGKLVKASEARVSVFDRGVLLGDGVYETLRVHHGCPFRWEQHHARLEQSLSAAGIHVPFSTGSLLEAVRACVDANELAAARIRITVTRGEGNPGFEPMPGTQPTVIIAASPWRTLGEATYRAGVAAIFATLRQTGKESLDPSLKSISRIHLVLARMEATRLGAQEAILLGSDGNVREGTASNVFMVSQGRLLTPPVDSGILQGVTRALIFELALEADRPCEERMVSPQDLQEADEVFLTNTSWGALPVARLNGQPVGHSAAGGVALELGQRIAERVEKECSR